MLIIVSGSQWPPDDGAIGITHAPAIAGDPAAPQLGVLALVHGPLKGRLPVEPVCKPVTVPDEGEPGDCLHSAPPLPRNRLGTVTHPRKPIRPGAYSLPSVIAGA